MTNATRAKAGAATLSDRILLDVDGRCVAVAVRRNARARRLTLRVPTAGGPPVLTLPPGIGLMQAERFVTNHSAWLATHLSHRPEATPFAPGVLVPVRGVPHRVDHRPETRGTVWTEAAPEGQRLCVSGDRGFIARRIGDFLVRQARQDLTEAVERHAAAIERPVKALRLRDTVSRWGSCTVDGVLSFSWRLILAPAFVLDYVAAHEVAHLIEMNHSPRFWAIVDRLCPDMDRARDWLRLHGPELHAVGATAA